MTSPGTENARGAATTADLRSALADLEAHGELATVSREVHWNRELGTVSRVALERDAPALLFDNIAGYNTPGSRCG